MKERGISPEDVKKKKAAAAAKVLAGIGIGAFAMNKSIEKKEEEAAKKENASKSKSAKRTKTVLNIEAPDQKTHLKAENFKNPKIMPLIEEAWDLLNKIKERQAEIDK